MTIITQLFSDAFIHAFGWTVLHSLWQATLIAIIVGLLLLAYRKKAATYRYNIAAFGLLSVFGSAIATFWYLYETTANFPSSPEITVLVGDSSVLQATEQFTTATISTFQDYFNDHLPLIVTLWLIGAGLFFLRLVSGLVYIQHLRSSQHALLDRRWMEMLQALTQQSHIKKTVALAESALINVPLVIGHLKPLILFPIGLVNHLTPQEVEAILAHELAHIYRNDYLVNIIQSLIETLFYYHPAVWWLSWLIQTEREHCCDDLAVQLSGNSLTYAKALLRVQELSTLPAPGFTLSFAGQKNQLLNRIQRVLNHPQNKSNFMEKLIATGLLTMLVLLLSVNANTSVPMKELLPDALLNAKETIELPVIAEPTVILNKSIPTIDNPSKATSTIVPNRITLPIEILATPLLDTRDTVPAIAPKTKKRSKSSYSYSLKNGQRVELESKDGEIQSLKINGEPIPKEQFGKYEELVLELMNTPVPPAPPAPPMPPMPSAIPAPPTPPSPPAPPSALFKSKSTSQIQRKTDDEGNTYIIIESEGSKDPIRIKVEDGAASTITIDGENLEDGQITIREEELDNPFADIRNMDIFSTDLNDFDVEEFLNQSEEKRALFEESFQKHKEEIEQWKMDIEEKKLFMEEELQLRNEEIFERFEQQKEKIEEELIHLREKRNFEALDAIHEELVKDGLIKEGKKVSYQLTNTFLKVNGKKQPAAIAQKYLSIYNSTADKPLGDGQEIRFKGRKGGKSKSSYRGTVEF